MILNDFIIIKKPTGKYFKYYKDLGYNVYQDNIEVKIEHLSLGSKYKIDVKCYYCGVEKKTDYNTYNKSTKNNTLKYSCKKCGSLKQKELFLEKYGVENSFQLETTKDKIKKTNLDKYDVEYYNQCSDAKSKFRSTNLEKYGVDNPAKLDEVKLKVKKTCFKKWGCDNYTKTDDYKLKTKEVNLKKWGYDSYSKTTEFKNKVKSINLEKYGVDHHTKTTEWKDKIYNINIEKYGINKFSSDIFRKLNFKIAKDDSYIKYIGERISLFSCDKGHEFLIHFDNYRSRVANNIPLCTICNPIGDSKSIKEKELFKFIESVYNDELIQSYRDGLEIDIYLPELKLGFEFNGLYWHSEIYKDKNYHLDKTNYFKEKGIRIIHIWEDDWDLKKDIIKSQIINLTKRSKKIGARNCYVSELENKIVINFLKDNHIQGSYKQIKKSIGLYYKDELVSVMTFDHNEGRKKMIDNEWNLSRFCNKLNTTVIGGASKLLKYFINNYKPLRIISYADKDWSIGDLYYKLGFNKLYETKPDYKYIINNKRYHKSNFRKRIKSEKTESQIMEEKNISKIFDCGKIKYELLYEV